jgi:hypothetical protein
LFWIWAAALLVLGAMTAPLLFGRVNIVDDLGAFHLPIRAFYAGQLARGEAFDWMPQLFDGFYLTGEGQAGTYHPWHWLLYRALPLPVAFELELLGSYPFMLWGMYWFLRRRLPRGAAALGSLAFTFSGFNLLHFVHPNAIAIVAHIPWSLGCIDRLMGAADRRGAAMAAAGLALLTGSQLLLGYPQYVWFSLLAEAGMVVFLWRSMPGGIAPQEHARIKSSVFVLGWHAVMRRSRGSACRGGTCPPDATGREGMPPHSPPAARHSPLPFLLAAKMVGLMLGGVQLLPMIDALTHAARQSPQAEYLASGSLNSLNLLQLIAPYLYADRVLAVNTHEFGLYIGAVPLVLLVWLACYPQPLGRLRPMVRAAGVLAVFAFCMALGDAGQIYRLQRFLPLVGSFRYPCRYLVLLHLATSILAAVGFVTLVRQYRGGRRVAWRQMRPLWIVVFMSVEAAIMGIVLRNRPQFGPWPAILLGPALISTAALLLTLAARGSRAALVGLVLFAALDLGSYGLSYAVLYPPYTARLDRLIAATFVPPGPAGGRMVADLMRFDDPGPRRGNLFIMAGWDRADGYAGLEPQRRLDYRQLAALRVAGVRWVRRSTTSAAIAGLLDGDPNWRRVPAPLPRVRLVTRVQPSDDPARDLARINIETTALVERGTMVGLAALDPPYGKPALTPCPSPAGGRGESRSALPGTAKTVVQRPGRWQIETDCGSEQLLVVAESFHSGWRARVDGRVAPVVRVNGDFLGCRVGPGRSEVVLEFRPWSLLAGRAMTCVGILLLIGLALPMVRLRRIVK